MRRSVLFRALTLALAFVHTFPAQKHLVALLHTPSFGEAWKGIGALCAVALYLLPLPVQVRGLRLLWQKRRGLLRAGGFVLAIAHAVPASDHIPRFIASGHWADAWRGVGSAIALAWFLAPLRTQAAVIGALGRLSRISPAALVAAGARRSWTSNL